MRAVAAQAETVLEIRAAAAVQAAVLEVRAAVQAVLAAAVPAHLVALGRSRPS